MSRLVLTNATVVDGDHGALADAHVVVDGDRIVAVGTGPFPSGGPEDRVIDLGGRTVMPGMVNCHFHATYHNLGATPAPFGLEEPMALQAVRAVNSLGLLLESGFTERGVRRGTVRHRCLDEGGHRPGSHRRTSAGSL